MLSLSPLTSVSVGPEGKTVFVVLRRLTRTASRVLSLTEVEVACKFRRLGLPQEGRSGFLLLFFVDAAGRGLFEVDGVGKHVGVEDARLTGVEVTADETLVFGPVALIDTVIDGLVEWRLGEH